MIIEEQSVTFVTSKIVIFPLSQDFGLFNRHELMIAHFLQIICIPANNRLAVNILLDLFRNEVDPNLPCSELI